MGLLTMMAASAALCLGIFGWLWLAMGFTQSGWRGVAGRIALQVSGLVLLWGLVQGRPILGLFRAVLPPLALPEVVQLAGFSAFLAEVLQRAAPVAALVLVLALAWRRLRPWAPGLAGAALILTGLVLGEGASRDLMCQSAAQRGLGEVTRIGLAASLSDRGDVELGRLHGLARAPDGTAWGWSYRTLDWFALPPDLVLPDLPPADCPG